MRTISRNKESNRKFNTEFSVEADKVEKNIIEYRRRQLVMARLVVKREETGERLVYPVLAVIE
jgi:hypothetical protein